MASSEIKHCRVAMLAVVGYLVQQVIHLPGEAYQESNPLAAVASVGWAPNLQILIGEASLDLLFLSSI